MSWECRNGAGRYYTRSRRVGGRIVREYLGKGIYAERAHQLDLAERQERQETRSQSRARLQSERVVEAEIKDYYAAVEAVLRNSLVRAGFHQHARGPWRKRRAIESP